MRIQDVTPEMFAQAGVRPVVGFVFRFDPEDAAYGVMAVTDGGMPQMKNFEAAAKVGKALQEHLYAGKPSEPQTATYYNEQGEPDWDNL